MIDQQIKFTVIGHGSWATAIVKILTDNGHTVGWYVRNCDVKEHIALHGNNPKYLSQVHFAPSSLVLYDDLNRAASESQVLVLATPSAFVKSVMGDLCVPIVDKFVISAIKGIVHGEWLTIAEWLNRDLGVPYSNIGVITGPCHAEEVALERLSYLTMVCKSAEKASQIGSCFASSSIRITTSNDIYGVEWASVLKNIYAIAGGVCHSLGYGDNFMAVLISNAAIEIERFLDSTYPCERQIMASAYLGDLLVTCYSQFSRNRTFGQMVGKGYTVRSAQMEMNMVAEGYYATACLQEVKRRNGYDVSMPIADAMYDILYNKRSAKATFAKILDKLI